jgi:hypothetical protein
MNEEDLGIKPFLKLTFIAICIVGAVKIGVIFFQWVVA